MTTTYLLSLMFSINGTANFLAIGSVFTLAWLFMYGHFSYRETKPKIPVWLWWVAGLSILAATVAPSRQQYIAAVAATQGPEVARELIQTLRESK